MTNSRFPFHSGFLDRGQVSCGGCAPSVGARQQSRDAQHTQWPSKPRLHRHPTKRGPARSTGKRPPKMVHRHRHHCLPIHICFTSYGLIVRGTEPDSATRSIAGRGRFLQWNWWNADPNSKVKPKPNQNRKWIRKWNCWWLSLVL